MPIRFVGVGEKSDDLELFHPERMASRMIGMGDVLSLIEKAERGIDAAETERLAKRMVNQQFTLEDLRDQLRQLRKLGPLASVLEMLPKVGPLRGLDAVAASTRAASKRVEAIINSMTPLERRRPDVLNGSRKKRIAMRLRHLGRGDQPPAQAVPDDAEDDEGRPGQVAAPRHGLGRSGPGVEARAAGSGTAARRVKSIFAG